MKPTPLLALALLGLAPSLAALPAAARPGPAAPARSPVQEGVRLRNHWQPEIYLVAGSAGPAAARVTAPGAGDRWALETVQAEPGSEFRRLRTQSGGTYLHVEHGGPELGTVDPGWWSAMWVVEPVEGTEFVRLRNRWKNTYLHIENGALEAGEAQPGWWSAMWVMEPAGPTNHASRIVADPVDREVSRRAIVNDPPLRYYVWVKTRSAMGAGTDANIRISLRGDRGSSGPHLLDTPGHDDFESGDLQRYDLGTLGIGAVSAVLLENDGAGSGPDWEVEWLCVEHQNGTECRNDRASWFGFRSPLRGNSTTVWMTR